MLPCSLPGQSFLSQLLMPTAIAAQGKCDRLPSVLVTPPQDILLLYLTGSKPFMFLGYCSSILLLVLCAKLLVPPPGFLFSLHLCFAYLYHCLCRCLFKAELSVPVGHTWVTAASCNLGKPISVITASFCIPLGLKTTPGFIRPSCSASTISPCPLAAPGAISYLLTAISHF